MSKTTIITRRNPTTGTTEYPWRDRHNNFVLGDPRHGGELHLRKHAVLTDNYDEALALVRDGFSIRMSAGDGRPPSLISAGALELLDVDIVPDGAIPPKVALAPFTIEEVISRDHLEALLEELLERADVIGAVLDRVAESPLAAGLGARIVTRVVGDVLAANRAVAERIPGLGSLVSLGNTMAVAAGSLAGRQLEGLVGDTAGKGATLAMRRLNKVLVETLKDPTAKDAALQVYDLYAQRPVDQVRRTGSREDTRRLAGLIQNIVIEGAAAETVLALSDALVDGFFAAYGELPTTTLIEDLGIGRDDLVGVRACEQCLHARTRPEVEATGDRLADGEPGKGHRRRSDPEHVVARPVPEVGSVRRDEYLVALVGRWPQADASRHKVTVDRHDAGVNTVGH